MILWLKAQRSHSADEAKPSDPCDPLTHMESQSFWNFMEFPFHHAVHLSWPMNDVFHGLACETESLVQN